MRKGKGSGLEDLQQKRFQKKDEGFVCVHCGKEVPPLGYTSRNHCPFCLWSVHVDILPGDRANPCGGGLRPIRTEPDPKKGFVIVHRCERCGEIRRNRAAMKGDTPDSHRLLIRLTAGADEL